MTTTSATDVIAATHPAFAGHFPGQPILPGVVLLDKLLQHAKTLGWNDTAGYTLTAVKFLRPVQPGETLHYALTRQDGQIRFSIACDGQAVAQGILAGPA